MATISSTLKTMRAREAPQPDATCSMHIWTSLLVVVLAVSGIRCTPTAATRVEQRTDFARHFDEAGVSGTFVLYDRASRTYLVHDEDRAARRFIPASTFKVLNALISLETGAVADTATVFDWDGVEREIPQWNADHSLTSAIRYSVVWYFQELARRVGEERMRGWLQRVEYGNASTGGGIDRFWLTGDLRISAMEQVGFLQRLYERSLPFSDETVDAVEGILVEDRGSDYVLRGKTGWADGVPYDVGWYVGYIVRGHRVFFFALNMDIESPEQGTLRRGIVRSILTDLRLL